IEKVKEKLVKLLPRAIRIGIGHGQMPSKELESVMVNFLDGKIDVLVCGLRSTVYGLRVGLRIKLLPSLITILLLRKI
ncbi:MAG: hypothetical protein V1650_03960, partial [Candidatus Omnitrophota bacterium]